MISFISAVFGALVGSLFMILATKKIEKGKLDATASMYLDSLYTELDDLKLNSKKSIELLFPLFCKIQRYQVGELELGVLYPVSIPRESPADILHKHYENCMLKLTLEQRNAMRTLKIHLAEFNGILETINSSRTNIGQLDPK